MVEDSDEFVSEPAQPARRHPARPHPTEERQDDSRRGVSRRGYLLGLGALGVLGTGAVVASQHVDADQLLTTGRETGTAGDGASGPVGRDGDAAAGTPLPVGERAPAVRPDGWLNSAPLTAAALSGHPVLYYFWTFECINCQHVQPYVRAWYGRYARDGLIVLSIHTPEFSFEADPDNVAEYVRANKIRYPVALDPQMRVWRAFGNRYWPALYLHDQQGRRRLTHLGEGGYARTEDAVRALLGIRPDSPRATVA